MFRVNCCLGGSGSIGFRVQEILGAKFRGFRV